MLDYATFVEQPPMCPFNSYYHYTKACKLVTLFSLFIFFSWLHYLFASWLHYFHIFTMGGRWTRLQQDVQTL